MIGVESLRACPHDHGEAGEPLCQRCDLPVPLRAEASLLVPLWRHRGGFAFLPPYEGPPRA